MTFLGKNWKDEEKRQKELAQSAMFNYDFSQNATAIKGMSSSDYGANANEQAEALVTRGEVVVA
jgi:hypothetical protein